VNSLVGNTNAWYKTKLIMGKNFYALLLALVCWVHVSAQITAPESHPCGTHDITPWLRWYHEHRHELPELSADTSWLYVPVTVHAVGDDNGNGIFPENEIFRNMCDLNRHFAQARIRFHLVPEQMIMYHASDYWYEHDFEGGANMVENTFIPGRLNAYIVEDPAGNCGYSGFDVIVLSKNCSDINYTTWPHEAGHHFSLPHTFFGWEGETWDYSQPAPNDWNGLDVERTDGTNCFFSADGFCDTPADYLNFRWNCNSQMRSNEVQTDPEGVQFTSDGTLLMSYSDQVCRRRFSPEQITAMRQNLYSEHSAYLVNAIEKEPIDDNAQVQCIAPVDSAIQQYNNVTFTWAPVENATFYRLEVGNTPNFTISFVNRFVFDTTSVTITSGLPNNRTLYWRVRPYSQWDLCRTTNTLPISVFKTRNVSAVDEVSQKVDVHVSPNPVAAGQAIRLQLTLLEGMDGQVRLNDLAGKTCFTQSLQVSAGEHTFDLEPGHLAAGHYQVQLNTRWGIITRPLVVTE
jgi:hypothetical protein